MKKNFLLFLISSFSLFGQEKEEIIMKDYYGGVVAISPQNGAIRFFHNTTLFENQFFQEIGHLNFFEKENGYMAYTYADAGIQHALDYCLLYVNTKNNDQIKFDLRKQPFMPKNVSSIYLYSSFCKQIGKVFIDYSCIEQTQELKGTIFFDLDTKQVIKQSNMINTFNRKYSIQAQRQWEISGMWRKHPQISMLLQKDLLSTYSYQLDFKYMSFINPKEKEILIFENGMDVKYQNIKKLFDLTSFAYIVRNLAQYPNFILFSQKENQYIDFDIQYKKYRKYNAPLTKPPDVSKIEAAKIMISAIKTGMNFCYIKSLKDISDKELLDLITANMEQNSRYFFFEKKFDVIYASHGERFAYPFKIKLVVDSTIKSNKDTLSTPLVWFTLEYEKNNLE